MVVFKKIDKAYGRLLAVVNSFTAFMVFILMLLITGDVVARSIFSHPFQGVSEIVSNCIIILCFLEIPYVLMRGTHVRSTILFDRLGVRGRAITDLIAALIGILVFSLIIYSSWGNFIKAAAINDAEIAGSVRISTVPGRFSIILGSVLISIEYLFLMVKNVARIINPQAFPVEKIADTQEGGNAI